MKDWEREALILAFRLIGRRDPLRLGWRGEQVQALGERKSRHAELAARMGGGLLVERAERFETFGEANVPPTLGDEMQRCQKPFQLWNVKRESLTYDYALDPQPPFSVGSGTTLPPEEQVPWTEPRCSQLLVQQQQEDELQAMQQDMFKQWFRHLFRQELPFGKPEPSGEEDSGKSFSWNPLSGEPPPPGVRLPPGFEPS